MPRLTLVAAVAASLASPAQALDIEWTRQFGAAGGAANGFAQSVDGDGNVYVAGRTDGVLPGQTGVGSADAFVRKYDASGATGLYLDTDGDGTIDFVDESHGWTRQFGTVLFDGAFGVAVDSSGVYVAGQTSGALTGDPGAGGPDVFVRKYDADGAEVWTRQFGSAAPDQPFGVAVHDGAVYVAGEADGALPGQAGVGGGDVFVRKCDATTGAEVWTRQFGTPVLDRATCISADASGVYVGGFSQAALPGQTFLGGSDPFVRKYDAAGNELWTRQFGTATPDNMAGVAVHASEVYVVGIFTSPVPGLPTFGLADTYVRKYDAAGTEIWTRRFGTAGRDQAFAVSADTSGVCVVGFTDGALVDPRPAGLGGFDVYVRKYDAGGTALWTRQFGTPAFDQPNGVSADSSGITIVGQTDGALPGETSAGRSDAFVRKYDAAGTELWTRQFDAAFANSSDLAVDVERDEAGNVYVAGDSAGTFPGQSSAGADDLFLRKYDAAGTLLWTRQFGSSASDFAAGVAVDSSGVYVAGVTEGALSGPSGAGAEDAFVRKYDPDGNVLWTRQFGTASVDLALGVAADGTGGVYVGGLTGGTLSGPASAPGRDAFVRKYDAIGTEFWTRQFEAQTSHENGGISADPSGVYIVGEASNTLPGQPAADGLDAFVRKYDPSGAEVWTSQFGTPAFDSVFAAAADSGEAVYVCGGTGGTLPGQASAGGSDAFVRKYDAQSGAVLWTDQFGTPDGDSPIGISVDSSGLYVVGATTGVFPGQIGAGGQDAFVRKYDASSGEEACTLQFGTLASDVAIGAAVDSAALYVAGVTAGTLAGASRPEGDFSSDAFLLKLVDATPPLVAPSCSPDILWPPDHSLRDCVLAVTISDCSLAFTLSITAASSEPGAGDIDLDPTTAAAEMSLTVSVPASAGGAISIPIRLRAERLGHGVGRTYTLTVTATDEAGNVSAETSAVVTVPHDQGK